MEGVLLSLLPRMLPRLFFFCLPSNLLSKAAIIFSRLDMLEYVDGAVDVGAVSATALETFSPSFLLSPSLHPISLIHLLATSWHLVTGPGTTIINVTFPLLYCLTRVPTYHSPGRCATEPCDAPAVYETHT